MVPDNYGIGDALGRRDEMGGVRIAEAACTGGTAAGTGRGVESPVGRVGTAAGCAGGQRTLDGVRVFGREVGALADVEAVARDGEGVGGGEMERRGRFRLQTKNKSRSGDKEHAKTLVPH